VSDTFWNTFEGRSEGVRHFLDTHLRHTFEVKASDTFWRIFEVMKASIVVYRAFPKEKQTFTPAGV
jgi:hypothetical protein